MLAIQESQSETLSIKESAAKLGVSEKHLYRLLARGELPVPVLRIGARIRVPRAALGRYIDSVSDSTHLAGER